MNQHKYILEPYNGMNTRYRCPVCQKRDKTFALYIDSETGEHIHSAAGRCNRESKCEYHYTPKQYFTDNDIPFDASQSKAYKPRHDTSRQMPVSFIPVEIFKSSLKEHESNYFVKFLIDSFGVDATSKVVSRYFIATSKHWRGATVFWQIDTQGKIRTGKIMLYNAATGKRVKEPFNHISWVHKVLEMPEFELKQCLFGEHLLIDKSKPVAIVESEKTAIIASIYLPQFIWVAVGSISNLNAEKCQILKGRSVVLFPDLNGFAKWSTRAKELSHLATFIVSNLLEKNASESERKQGLDIADYLLKFDLTDFVSVAPESNENVQPLAKVELIESIEKAVISSKPIKLKSESWIKEITELEEYFSNSNGLPKEQIRLSESEVILNISKFVENHLSIVKSNDGKRTFLPYLDRLNALRMRL